MQQESSASARRRRRVALSLCAVLLTMGMSYGQVEHGGVISGSVNTTRGKAERIRVQLSDESGIPAGDVYTDSNGGFVFRSLPNGVYHVVVQAEGYQPFHQVVRLDTKLSTKQQVYVQLEPVASPDSPSAPVIPGSARTYKLNVKDQSRPLDPKALREFDKGNEAARGGNLKSAIRHYQRALRIDSSCYPALNNLGTVYLRQGNTSRAKEAFEKSVELNPEDSEGYINLGHALYQEGQYPQAIERLGKGLRLSPRSGVGFFFRGSAYLKVNELDRAEADLRKAAELDPTLGAAHLQLANLYLRRHENAAATTELEAYLRTNPSDPQAPSIKKMLASLKDR